MKRIAKGMLAAATGLALLAGCGNGGGASGGGNTVTGDTIKLGVNYELSGGVASYGQSSVDGIKLAVEQVNAAGGVKGKKIDLVQVDNKSEAAESTTLATKLMTQDKVLAVLGPATSGNFKAQIPVALKNKVPVVSGSATADDVTVDAQGVKEYAFRVCFNDSFQGTAAANYSATKFNAKSAVIIKDTASDYSKGLAENFTKTFKDKGGSIVSEENYTAKDTDFNAILTSVKSKTFDVIYLPGYYEEAGLIIKQARALGITQPVIGGDGFDSPKLAELAGSGLTKVYFTNHYSSLDKDPAVIKFIEEFKAKYNREPDAFNALGYDEAKFVIDGINRAEKMDSESLKTALAGTKDFVGVTGKFSIDANHNPVKSIVVIEMDGGKQVGSEKVAA